MTEVAFIYELRDPETGRPRYVGMTRDRYYRWHDNLRTRLVAHVRQPFSGTAAKADWILALKSRGLKPTIHLLETVPADQAGAAERRWIQLLRSQGEDLLNRWPEPNSPPQRGPRPRLLRYRSDRDRPSAP